MRTVQIDGQTYAVGFWWQIPSGGRVNKKEMLRQARETAAGFADEGYSYAALRSDQYGLARYDGIIPDKKTVSLAASLRPASQQDGFLGVFCLEESLWWVCGIIRGLVAADGDVICKTKEEAREAAASVLRLMEGVGLEEVIHESPEASQAFLIPLLWPEKPLTPLDDSERQKRLLRQGFTGVALFLAFCLVPYWLYSEYQVRHQAGLNAKTLAAKEALRREAFAHPERYFRKHWLDAPDFATAGRQCAEAVLSPPVSVNAWMLEEAVCSPGASLQLSWTHTEGASFIFPPSGASPTTPKQAKETRVLPALSVRFPSEEKRPLFTKEQVEAVMYELTQNIGCHLSLAWAPPESFQIDEETTVFSPWQRGVFELSQIPATALLGADLFGALSHPGSLLVSLTQKTNESVIKGYIYAAVSSKH